MHVEGSTKSAHERACSVVHGWKMDGPSNSGLVPQRFGVVSVRGHMHTHVMTDKWRGGQCRKPDLKMALHMHSPQPCRSVAGIAEFATL